MPMMNQSDILRALAATVVIVSTAASTGAAQGASDDEINRRRSDFLAALAARDASRTSGFFADEAVFQTADMPAIRGRQAIQQFYTKLFGFIVSSEATSETMRVASAGDMAYDVGRAKNTFKGTQGTVEYAGKYLTVWVKQQGEWRIAAYSVSSDSARP